MRTKIAEKVAVAGGPQSAVRPLRVLQLIPAAKKPGCLTSLTLMDEELLALHNRGVLHHSIVHQKPEIESHVLQRHVIPRIRNPSFSLGTLLDCFQHWRLKSYATPSLIGRFQLTRMQRWIEEVSRQEQVSLIHSHWARPNGTAGAAAKVKTGLPLVMTLRGADVLNEPSIGYGNTLDPWFVRRLQFALKVADKVIGVSSAIANRAIELGADPNRTVVIHKGVDTEKFCPAPQRSAREKLDLADRPTVLFVGAFGSWKGVSDLLDAFVILRKEVSEAQLVMAGKGPLLETIQNFIRTHHLKEHVRLTGHVDRETIPVYFQACDLFVLPSLTEGSGNVLLEAASCGRPAVGTRVGGIPDYLLDGQTGLLCEKRNPVDLAEKLIMLLTDSKLANQFGEQGRQRVCQEFRYDQMIDKIIEVYRSVQ